MQGRSAIEVAIYKVTRYEDEFYKDIIPILEDIIEEKNLLTKIVHWIIKCLKK